MFVQYGSYRHSLNEAEVMIQRTPVWNDGGELKEMQEVWTLRGELHANSSAALTPLINQLVLAYQLQGQDLRLCQDDGSVTSHNLLAAQCIGGTRVTQAPSFPQGRDAEYATYRSYEIKVEGRIPNLQVGLLAYVETLTFEGGGPMDVHIQTLTGLPQKQRVAQSTPYRVSQDGSAIGYFNYPAPPNPIWPAAWKQDKTRISRKSPKRDGPVGRPTYTEFEITWHYEFEDALPLTGVPNRWIV